MAVSSHNDLPVRVICCRAIAMFSRKVEKHRIELPESMFQESQVAAEIISMPVTSETVNVVLEALIELARLSKSQTRFLASNSQFLLGAFH